MHVKLNIQRLYQLTIDTAAFMKDKPKHGKGRPHLMLIDKLKVDMDVDRAKKGESSYD